tara:strand:+ start:147 stop:857 length:711 start_codon:yes stop_codon:yes gene_type:complete
MNKLFFAFLTISLLSACTFFQNCIEADPEIVTEELSLDKINELSLASGIEVHIQQAESQSVSFEGPANYLEVLNQNVKNGEWVIKFDRCLKEAQKVKLNISLVDLKGLEINGSGKIIGSNTFMGDDLELEIAGSGDIDLDLDYKSLSNEINGSGTIKLRGKVKSQEIQINGSGDVLAIQLNSDNTEVEINGSGDVEVSTSYSLNVEVNGSGDVKYVGSPKELNSEINGSGKLEQVN